MNDELVEKRLSDIESKIDKLMCLVEQTHLQEYRISALESNYGKLHDRIHALEHKSGNLAVKILAWIAGGIGTILLSFIAVKVGLK